MNFGEAFKAMQMGSKVSREKWRGSIAYWKILERRAGEPEIYQYRPDGKKRLVLRIEVEHIMAQDWWIVT